MSDRPTIAYQPALDGVRACAVTAVLLFHGGVPGFDGGYLGVSVFFTLSGFLITTLLLDEHARTGRIDLARFYARRLRRLLPASAVCLVGVALIGAMTGLFDAVTDLRAHVVGAVFQVANWVFLAGDGSYQDLLTRTGGAPSPLEHFWSLAIEEQFYWIWPPVMLLVLACAPHRRARIVLVGAMTGASMLAAPVIAATWGPDAAYWATPARIGEILIGAFLAVVLAGRAVPERFGRVTPVALGLLAIAVVAFPSSGGPAYAGALPLVGVVSAGLILGLQADGPVRRALAAGPLVWVGRISYGLYLFHWPIFVLIGPERVGWPQPVLLAVRLAVTVAVSVLSYRLVEHPIRTADRWKPRMTIAGAGAATVGLLASAVVIVPSGLGEYWVTDSATAVAAAIEVSNEPLEALTASPVRSGSPEADADTASSARSPKQSTSAGSPDVASTSTSAEPAVAPASTTIDAATTAIPAAEATAGAIATATPAMKAAATAVATTTTTTSATTTPTAGPNSAVPTTSPAAPTSTVPTSTSTSTVPPLPALSRPTRIVVIGDSTANAFGTGLVGWAADRPDIAQVEVVAAPGCGILRGGERRAGDALEPIVGCDHWLDEFAYPSIERLQPDVVMVMVTTWDLVDRRWDEGAVLTPFDDAFAVRLHSEYDQLRADLLAAGAGRVAFVRHPIPDVWWLPAVDAQEDPDRHQVMYDVYERLAAADDRVDVVDLDRWFSDQRLDRDQAARPDGVHPTPEMAVDISERYLSDQLVRIALGIERP